MESLGSHRTGNPAIARVVALIRAGGGIREEQPTQPPETEPTEGVREIIRESGGLAVQATGVRRPETATVN